MNDIRLPAIVIASMLAPILKKLFPVEYGEDRIRFEIEVDNDRSDGLPPVTLLHVTLIERQIIMIGKRRFSPAYTLFSMFTERHDGEILVSEVKPALVLEQESSEDWPSLPGLIHIASHQFKAAIEKHLEGR